MFLAGDTRSVFFQELEAPAAVGAHWPFIARFGYRARLSARFAAVADKMPVRSGAASALWHAEVIGIYCRPIYQPHL